MTIATKLSEARLLIERGWTRHANARAKSRRVVTPYGDSAVCWCSYGALIAVDAPFDAVVVLKRAIGGRSVITWNDDPKRKKSEVIEAFKRAEQLARDSAE